MTSRVVRLTPEAIRCVMSKSGSRNCLIGIRTVDSTRLGQWDENVFKYGRRVHGERMGSNGYKNGEY